MSELLDNVYKVVKIIKIKVSLSKIKKVSICIPIQSVSLNLKPNAVTYIKSYYVWIILFIKTLQACICVFILLHRKGFFHPQHAWDILEGTDQRSCVVTIILGASAKFLHLRFLKCHISPPKTKILQPTNWRKNDMIYCTRRKYDIHWYRI